VTSVYENAAVAIGFDSTAKNEDSVDKRPKPKRATCKNSEQELERPDRRVPKVHSPHSGEYDAKNASEGAALVASDATWIERVGDAGLL